MIYHSSCIKAYCIEFSLKIAFDYPQKQISRIFRHLWYGFLYYKPIEGTHRGISCYKFDQLDYLAKLGQELWYLIHFLKQFDKPFQESQEWAQNCFQRWFRRPEFSSDFEPTNQRRGLHSKDQAWWRYHLHCKSSESILPWSWRLHFKCKCLPSRLGLRTSVSPCTLPVPCKVLLLLSSECTHLSIEAELLFQSLEISDSTCPNTFCSRLSTYWNSHLHFDPPCKDFSDSWHSFTTLYRL